MEEQANFEKIKIGTKESKKLEPAIVRIVKATIESVGDKDAKKVSCEVKHPSSIENIKISAVKLERKGKLEITGLWFNLDDEGLLRKGSATANFLQFMNASDVSELTGKQCNTTEDDSGYLVFKAY